MFRKISVLIRDFKKPVFRKYVVLFRKASVRKRAFGGECSEKQPFCSEKRGARSRKLQRLKTAKRIAKEAQIQETYN